jgi:hypothetical protein
VSRFAEGFTQNAANVADYERRIEEDGLATARGVALSADGRWLARGNFPDHPWRSDRHREHPPIDTDRPADTPDGEAPRRRFARFSGPDGRQWERLGYRQQRLCLDPEQLGPVQGERSLKRRRSDADQQVPESEPAT